ncbi:MAG: FAD-dependent oxidoreductase [Acidobacteriota bacterium]
MSCSSPSPDPSHSPIRPPHPEEYTARLLLVGGGHAHLEVLRRLHLQPASGLQLTVVSALRHHHYSGMIPGYLRGTYTEEMIRVDLPPLVRAAAGRFLVGRAIDLDVSRCRLTLDDGRVLPYDLISLGVGSLPEGSQEVDVQEHASVIKPLSRTVRLRRSLLELAARGRSGSPGQPQDLVVVGGGAAGVEMALAMAGLLDEAGCPRHLAILEAGGTLLAGYSVRFRRRAEGILAARGIQVRRRAPVEQVAARHLTLQGGERVSSHLTVWLAGARGQPFLARTGLPVDSRGFLLVDRSLRSISDRRVFAAGDCATLRDHPRTPKAGVYAVRQGPVLWASLMAAIRRQEPPRYHPQDSFLSILSTGDGKALLRYKALISHSRWAWWLKDRIDRRFMGHYTNLCAAGSGA